MESMGSKRINGQEESLKEIKKHSLEVKPPTLSGEVVPDVNQDQRRAEETIANIEAEPGVMVTIQDEALAEDTERLEKQADQILKTELKVVAEELREKISEIANYDREARTRIEVLDRTFNEIHRRALDEFKKQVGTEPHLVVDSDCRSLAPWSQGPNDKTEYDAMGSYFRKTLQELTSGGRGGGRTGIIQKAIDNLTVFAPATRLEIEYKREVNVLSEVVKDKITSFKIFFYPQKLKIQEVAKNKKLPMEVIMRKLKAELLETQSMFGFGNNERMAELFE